MSLILTNDDGIDAPGIQALLKAVEQVGKFRLKFHREVIIAAPQGHLSGCGHQVTTASPLTLERRSHSGICYCRYPGRLRSSVNFSYLSRNEMGTFWN